MSDAINEGATTPTHAAGEAESDATPKATSHPKLRSAITLAKEHPLGAVAFFGAAAALLEVELAVGILAGLGATALLAKKTGPEARQEVLTRGKWALDRLDRARVAIKARHQSSQPAPVAPTQTEAAPPPS